MMDPQIDDGLKEILGAIMQSQQHLAQLIEQLGRGFTPDKGREEPMAMPWSDDDYPEQRDQDSCYCNASEHYSFAENSHHGMPMLPKECYMCCRCVKHVPKTVGNWVDQPVWDKPYYGRPVRQICFLPEE